MTMHRFNLDRGGATDLQCSPEIPTEYLKHLTFEQKQQLATIVNNLCGESFQILHMYRIAHRLRQLGFTIWSFDQSYQVYGKMKPSIILIETGRHPRLRAIDPGKGQYNEAIDADENDPFKLTLEGLYDSIFYGHRQLIRGSRGGFSFNEIDQCILPEFAKRMDIARDQLRLPTQHECLLTIDQAERDICVAEWFHDGRKQPDSQEIIDLRRSIAVAARALSDDAIYDRYFDRMTLRELLEKQGKQERTASVLRGNHVEANFIPSDNHAINSFFRCAIDLS